MTNEEVASLLNGLEYDTMDTYGIVPNNLRKTLKELGKVVVHTCSDDIIVLDGAWADEIYNNQHVNKEGVMFSACEKEDDCPYFAKIVKDYPQLTVNWDTEYFTVSVSQDVPYSKFFIIDDGDKYCQGIVFDIKDLPE